MRTGIRIALALGFASAMAIGAPIPAKAQGCPCATYDDDYSYDRSWSERGRHRRHHDDDVNDRPWSERSASWLRRHDHQYYRAYGHRHYRDHGRYDAYYDGYYYVEDYSRKGPWYYRSYYFKGNGNSPVYRAMNRAYDIR